MDKRKLFMGFLESVEKTNPKLVREVKKAYLLIESDDFAFARTLAREKAFNDEMDRRYAESTREDIERGKLAQTTDGIMTMHFADGSSESVDTLASTYLFMKNKLIGSNGFNNNPSTIVDVTFDANL